MLTRRKFIRNAAGLLVPLAVPLEAPAIIIKHKTVAGGGSPTIEDFTYNGSNSVDYLTLTKPSGVVNDNLLLMALASSVQIAPDAVTGFTLLAQGNAASSLLSVHYRIATGHADETDPQIGDSDVHSKMAWYIRIAGNATSSIFNFTNTVDSVANSGTHVIPEGTTSIANCLALYFLGADGGDTFPYTLSGTGWVEEDQQQTGTASSNSAGTWGSKEMASAGDTVDATITFDGNSDGSNHFQCAIAPA